MKSLLLLALLICPFVLKSQVPGENAHQPLKRLKLSTAEFGLGIGCDYYENMSLEDLKALSFNPSQLNRDLAGFDEEVNAMASGASILVGFVFSPGDFSKGVYRQDREIRVEVGIHSPKEAMVSYKNEDLDTSIVYCGLQSEISLGSSYIFKGRWGKKFIYRYGFGGTLGTTLQNQVIVISGKYFGPEEHPSEQESEEQNKEVYGARNLMFFRAFVLAGIAYEFGKPNVIENKWSLGIEFRLGTGLQKIQGGNTVPINQTSNFIYYLRYRFG